MTVGRLVFYREFLLTVAIAGVPVSGSLACVYRAARTVRYVREARTLSRMRP